MTAAPRVGEVLKLAFAGRLVLVRFAEVTPCLLQFGIERLVSRLRLRLCRCRVWCSPIVERAVATSGRLSAVDVEGSLVRWHPSHVGAIWAASASEVILQGLVVLSLILWRPTLSEDG